MKKLLLLTLVSSVLLFSCKKEHADDLDHDDEEDLTYPVVTLSSPIDSSVYHNGDTIFMVGNVSDNELHTGVLKIIDDTTAFEYYSYVHYVHDMSSSPIDFIYVVNGITVNSAVTLRLTYDDHVPNTTVLTRRLIFMP